MAETVFRGPSVNTGATMDGRVEPFDGPDISYQASVVIDPRFSPIAKDGLAPARIPTFFNSPYFVLTDNIPSATSSTLVAAAQAATALLPLTLATAAGGLLANTPSFVPGIPIIPQGTTTPVTVGAIDLGFTTSTTTVNSTTLPVPDSTQFYQGQWIVVGGVGNAAKTAGLITQVVTTNNATTITIANAALASLANAPIAQGNLYSQFLPPATQFGPSAPAATATEPYALGGISKIFDPLQGVARNLTVTGNTTIATAAVLITGYDIFGAKMTELITANSTNVVAGNKCFKYVLSAVPQGTFSSATVAVGLGNLVGINIRSDKWEYLNVFYNGGFMTNNNGWTAAVKSPANATTGDTRGTLQLANMSTIGTAANGTARLTIMMSVPLYNMINATPVNSTSLFGFPQA